VEFLPDGGQDWPANQESAHLTNPLRRSSMTVRNLSRSTQHSYIHAIPIVRQIGSAWKMWLPMLQLIEQKLS
jgi:hypothetical protein